MNDEPGKLFRMQPATGFDRRSQKVDGSVCILIVDPVLGSRFSLADAAASPGYFVKTASSVAEALIHLEQNDVSLVIVDQQLAECDGIDFLVEIRGRFPKTLRVLVTASESISFIRGAIGRAGLCFLLSKPWSPSSLRKTIREVIGGSGGTESGFKGWDRMVSQAAPPSKKSATNFEGRHPDRKDEVLLRGLLAGLNSCEFESEIFELLHSELARPFGIRAWLWIDEDREVATRIADDWPIESGVALGALDPCERRLLSKARKSIRVTRLDGELLGHQSGPSHEICLGLAIRDEGRRTGTCLIWAEGRHRASLVSMMRELQAGLQLVFRRVRLADARAVAARRLAQHVSEELRTPIGALAHAIDRLRGETERAGLSTEWVDRVSSESARVVRAVEQLEGEIATDELGMHGSAG